MVSGFWGDSCQRAIVITASVAQAITRRVKAQQRNQQNRGLDRAPVARHRDVPNPTRQLDPWAPRPELQRLSRFHNDRQGGLGAKGEKLMTNIRSHLGTAHPIEYANFEGTIPQGEYGAGTVMIWDRGNYVAEGDPVKGLQEGKLKFRLNGKRLKGGFTLVRMQGAYKDGSKNWLLIKEPDEYGIKSGRTMEAIASRRKGTTTRRAAR
jgi:hypothetical protein